MTRNKPPGGPIRILISSCLLGEKVRYDGGHKYDPFLAKTLGRFVEYVPVCPEVECGLPTPREPMHLAGDPADPRLVASKSGVDHTARMRRWARKTMRELVRLDLCGYICKMNSPSCGMERVTVHGDGGVPGRAGVGMFTRMFMEHFPLLPVEEEGRLQDSVSREMFVDRLFTLRRFRDALKRGNSRGNLVEFHTDHKLFLLARGRTRYTEMGKLVAAAKAFPPGELYGRYAQLLMEALRNRPTPRGCVDVLMHMAGYFRRVLTPDEKRRMLESIERYRNRLVPLAVPLALFRRHARKHDVAYLARQVFLNPHPVELELRNHV